MRNRNIAMGLLVVILSIITIFFVPAETFEQFILNLIASAIILLAGAIVLGVLSK